jgi:hypothetical protein
MARGRAVAIELDARETTSITSSRAPPDGRNGAVGERLDFLDNV